MANIKTSSVRVIEFRSGPTMGARASGAVSADEIWPLLDAHVVNGVRIVPGIATVLEMIATVGADALRRVVFSGMLSGGDDDSFSASIEYIEPKVAVTAGNGTPIATALSAAADIEPLAPLLITRGNEVDGEELYADLDASGNNYGQPLHVVTSVLTSEAQDQLVATWSTESAAAAEIVTAAVDGAFHVMGGRAHYDVAFLLTGIDHIMIPRRTSALSPTGSIVLSITAETNSSLTADVDVIAGDDVLARLRGVEIRAFGAGADVATIGLAATFSTDPIDNVVKFWSNELQHGVRIQAAGYGQLFQELLTGGEAFTDDSDVHLGLIKVDDWLHERETADLPDGLDTTVLPNGLPIAQLNQYESDYLYNEIFIDTVYARHGIDIGDDATVVDVGANIGMFALFAASRANNVQVIAVEPSPVVAPILQANLNAHVARSELVNAGMAEHNGHADLTFYPKSSVFSTFDPEVETERESILAIVENTVRAAGNYSEELIDDVVEQFMADRVEAVSQSCELVSLGEVIDRYNLTEIDLMKVDAEKSERGILDGIRDEDWPKIKQLIVEIHWLEPHGISDVVEQLEARGYVCVTDEEDLLVGSGLYTVYATMPGYVPAASTRGTDGVQSTTSLADNVDLFLDAAHAHLARTNRPTAFVLCPPVDQSSEVLAQHSRLAEELASTVAIVIEGDDLVEQYQVDEVFDPVTDRLGHVPYTSDFFAALGTQAVRFLLASSHTPRKLIVLDCDNTLWDGTVGEDGIAGLTVDAPALAVQEFAKDAIGRGMIVALASKNDEQDVRTAFDQVDGMLLTWDNIAAHRVNWDPKSQNIRDMAAELGIGSDSAAFFDDSRLEIGEVRSRAPEVLTISLEDRATVTTGFFSQIWELDSFGHATEEDKRRADMYKQESRRRQLESGSGNYADFIAQLDLTTTIEALDDTGIARASQMTQRTNQFNTTTVRRSEVDFRSLLSDGLGGTTVRVKDRFGDYGVVGLMTYRREADTLGVDSFMMSCRALGRGVEHEMIRSLGKTATTAGVETIEIAFKESDRNEPVRRFLDTLIANGTAAVSGTGLTLTADAASRLHFEPTELVAEDGEGSSRSVQALPVDSERSERIARDLGTGALIIGAIRDRSEKPRPIASPLSPPENDVQTELVEVWRSVLGYNTFGIDDNFFEFGGTSLLAVELIAAIQANGSVPDYRLVDLFDRPTIRRMTETEQLAAQAAESRSRGAQRRQMATRRTRR